MTFRQDSDSKTPSEKAQLRRSLEQSRIFGDLDATLITNLVDLMRIRVIPGGDTLFHKGDNSDSLLVVVSGRLVASKKLADGSTQRLTEIGPGSSVGEVGLILRQPRAADVVAIRDTSVASLSRRQFETLLTRHPIEVNRAITRTIFEISQQSFRRPAKIGATTFAVVSLNQNTDTLKLCIGITEALKTFGSVCHFTPTEGEKFHNNDEVSSHTSAKFSDLEQEYDFIVLEASAHITAWTHLAIRQADQLILVANETTVPHSCDLANSILTSSSFKMVRKSLVLLHPPKTPKPMVDSHWRNIFSLERIYPVRIGRQKDEQRLVRFITDNAIGLVLGGGGARGLAHIGVLKALRESKIPIDMVCGNSMGALIGAQYVYGTPIDALLESTKRFVRGGERLTIPLFSILSGKRVKRDLQNMFSDTCVEALWRPFYAVSCNLSKAKIKVHEDGPLWEAVLASNSPAGLLPPVICNGDLLVDAALLDNVPVEALRKKLGFGTLIAVDVDVSKELSVDPQIKQLTGWKVLYQRLFRPDKDRLPGIIDLLYRSGHLGGLATRATSIPMADHYLQPPMSQFALMAYGRGQEIVDAGYHYTKAQISSWPIKPAKG